MNGQRSLIENRRILSQSFLHELECLDGLSVGLICAVGSGNTGAVGGAVGLRERAEAMEGKASGGRLCGAIDTVEGKASGGRLLSRLV
jgi:hypothetical protein